jgi:Flp pilus assembly protein TadB/Mg-chelatase subunit ChlD
VVIRRFCVVGGAALAMVLAAPWPARADDALTVTVAAATPGHVQLTAFAEADSAGQAPVVAVSYNGTVLPSAAEVVRAAASPSEARAVVVVLDTGGSMAGDALRAADDAVLGFARAVPADVQVGLVTVADTPSVRVRPTRDRAAIGAALSSVHAAARTDLYSGVGTATDLVAGYADRRVLVVSDGRGAISGAGAAAMVRAATAAGTRVDVVAFRAAPDRLESLRQLVTATGGTAYPSASPDALAGALSSAAATFPIWLTIAVTVPATLAGSSGSLTVAVSAGATRLTAAVPVQFAASTSRTAVARRATSWSGWALRPSLLGVLVFVAIMTAALLVTAPMRRAVRPRRLSQLSQFRLAGHQTRRTGLTAAAGTEGTLAHAVHDLSDRVPNFHGMLGRVASRLEQAGMTVRPGEWILLRSGATVVGGVLLALLAGLPGLLAGAVLGWLAAGMYRRWRESRRRIAFAEQLPDALQLIVGSLRSGFSLAQAIDAVSRDMPAGPLTAVFGRVMAETRIGADLGDALERAAERIDNEDLAWVVMAVRIQRDTGGNLAEVLQTAVDTLRERERLRRHVWALSAEGRLSAYILIALPILMAGFMFVARRAYLSALWTTRPGLVMLIGAIALVVIGSIWMSRWVKVEV